MTEPTGVTLEDQATGQLLHHERLHLPVVYEGRTRTLRLRLARGVLEAPDAAPTTTEDTP